MSKEGSTHDLPASNIMKKIILFLALVLTANVSHAALRAIFIERKDVLINGSLVDGFEVRVYKTDNDGLPIVHKFTRAQLLTKLSNIGNRNKYGLSKIPSRLFIYFNGNGEIDRVAAHATGTFEDGVIKPDAGITQDIADVRTDVNEPVPTEP
jgi:hypothetical protein